MSQPTMSRWENAPGLRDLKSLGPYPIKRKSRDPLGSPVLEFPVIYGDCHVWRHSSLSDCRVFGPPNTARCRPRGDEPLRQIPALSSW